MDLTQQILGGVSGVVELPDMSEALARIGFFPIASVSGLAVSVINVGGSLYASASVRPRVCADLVGMMYEVKPSFDVLAVVPRRSK